MHCKKKQTKKTKKSNQATKSKRKKREHRKSAAIALLAGVAIGDTKYLQRSVEEDGSGERQGLSTGLP